MDNRFLAETDSPFGEIRFETPPQPPQPPLPTLHEPRETPAAYDLRVELREVEPPVWREFTVSSDKTLRDLHSLLQIVMGWEGTHLHGFVLEGFRPFLSHEDVLEGETDGVAEDAVRLDQVLRSPGDSIRYDYDFGDGWEHDVTLKRIRNMDAPVATELRGGARACPLEDVGGPHSYMELVRQLRRPPANEEDLHPALLYWEGLEDFDPEALHSDEIAMRLELFDVRPSMDQLHPEFAELIKLSSTRDLLLDMAAAADLKAPSTLAHAVLGTWLHHELMVQVGDGVKLTQAGYLPTAIVKAIREKGNLTAGGFCWGRSEKDVPWLHEARLSATKMGLLRLANGRLTVTAAGRKLVDDPEALLAHIVKRFPTEKSDVGRAAAWLVLLNVASFEAMSDDSPDWFELLMGGLGYRLPPDAWFPSPWQLAPLTMAALPPAPVGSGLARALLLRPEEGQ